MLLCTQLQGTSDDCCTEEVCNQPAVWVHEASGLGMCASHESNARKYGGAKMGEWRVGLTAVSYPDGWTNIEDGSTPPAAEEQKSSSGLILDLS